MSTEQTLNNHLDVNELARGMAAPTFTVGRLVYRGRVLSILEWLPYAERFDVLQAQELAARDDKTKATRPPAPRAWITLYRSYLRAVFPRRRYAFWLPHPVRLIEGAPGNALREAFFYFFGLQLAILREERVASSESPTAGTSSPSSIPAVDEGAES